MKKRFLSTVVAALATVSMMPLFAIPTQAADSIPLYYPKYISSVPIINAELASYAKFLNSDEAKMKYFNAEDCLGLDYKMKETLDFYVNRSCTQDNFGDSAFWNLHLDDQISVRFGAKLRGDKHGSVKNHAFSYKYSYQTMMLADVWIKGPTNDDRKVVYSKDEAPYFNVITTHDFDLRISSGGCDDCGSPKFSNPFVLFADTVQPYIEGFYMTDTDTGISDPPPRSEAVTYTSTGDMYFHIVFSESIRFANMSDEHDDLRLGLNFANRYTNTSIQETVYADIYALRDNVLTFKYTVPEKLGKTVPNHKLLGFTGITVASGQDALYKKDAYSLKIKLQDTGADTVTNIMAKASKAAGKTSITAKNLEDGGYTMVDSIITDLAGNSLLSNSTSTLKNLVSGENAPVVDFTAPYIENIDISLYRYMKIKYTMDWKCLTADVANGDTVSIYGRSGDLVKFVVTVSELADSGQYPFLITNILDKDGQPIMIQRKSQLTKNGTPTKTEYTFELTLTDDMTLPENESIQVTGMTSFDDYYGNPLGNRPQSGISEPGKQVPSVNRTLFYDRLAPTITTDTAFTPDETTGGSFTVGSVGDLEALGYIDFTITDVTDHGDKNASGTIQIGDQAVRGTLNFTTAQKPLTPKYLEYALVPTGISPDDIGYISARIGEKDKYTFNQGIGKQDLYIRLPEDFPADLLPLTVKIDGTDFVGNQTSFSMTLDAEYFISRLDRTAPTIEHTGQVSEYDPATQLGSITDSFTVSDSGLIAPGSVQYALVTPGNEPTEDDWQGCLDATANAESFSFSLKKEFGADTSEFHGELYVRANDTSAHNNQTVVGPFTLDYNYSLPILTIESNENVYTTRPKLKVDAVQADEAFGEPMGIALIRPRNAGTYMDGKLFTQDDHYILASIKLNSYDLMNTVWWQHYGTWDAETKTFRIVDDKGYLEVFMDYYNQHNFNDTLDVEAYFAYGLTYDAENGTIYTTENRPISDAYHFTYHKVGVWYEGMPALYTVDAEWVDPEELEANTAWTPDSEGFPALTDLAGAMIDVSITNHQTSEFGLLVLDSDRSYVEVVDDTGAVLYTQNLYAAETRIVLPEGLEYNRGKHKISINAYVATAYNGYIGDVYQITNDSADIYVYPDDIGDFGISGITGTLPGSNLVPGDLLDKYTTQYNFENETTDENGDTVLSFIRPDRVVLNAYQNSLGIGYIHKLYLRTTLTDNKAVNIKVTNITDGVSHTSWWKYGALNASDGTPEHAQYTIVVYDNLDVLNAAIHDPNTVPVIANTDNLISYRLVHANGQESAEYTFTLYPDTTMDETVLSLTSDGTEGPISTVSAVVDTLPIGATLYHYRWDPTTKTNTWTEVVGSTVELAAMNDINLTDADELFCTIDREGNFDVIKLTRPENLWLHVPEITSEAANVSNTVQTDFMITQPTANYDERNIAEDGFKLHITFEGEYAERVGAGTVTFDIPPAAEYNENGLNGFHNVEISAAQRQTGLFYMGMQAMPDGTVTVKQFSLVHKYNPLLAEGAIDNVTVTYTVEDIAGNISAPCTVTYPFVNTQPKATGFELAQKQQTLNGEPTKYYLVPTLTANVPIAEVFPNTFNPDGAADSQFMSTYSYNGGWGKGFVNIYRDGVYDISFTDVFGEIYNQTITVDPSAFDIGYGYDLGVDIQFSEPDPTTGKVEMTFRVTDDKMKVSLSQSPTYDEDSSYLAYVREDGTVELDPTLPLYLIRYYPYGENSVMRVSFDTVIPAFVNTPPQARVEWYFDEFSSDTIPELYNEDGSAYIPTSTTQNVTAYLSADRHLNPINGTAESYTFTYGGDDSYTFEFEDLSGQQGSLTVTLPIQIDAPIPAAEDTTAPDYSIEIYGRYSASYASEYTLDPVHDNLTDALDAISWVRGYMLNFQISDESPTTLVIREHGADHTALTYANAENAVIDGIRVSGSQVYIDAAADFDVVLIDAKDHMTVVTVKGSAMNLDLTPPTVADIQKERTGLYEMTAYVLLADDKVGVDGIEWIYPQDSKLVTEGTYTGRYAVVFNTNKTISVRYADKLGNQGSHDITVTELDSTVPKITKITWNPGDAGDPSKPPRTMLNKNVTALVEFSTPIKELELQTKNAIQNLFDCDVLLQNDHAVLTFSDSAYNDEYIAVPWDLTLEYIGINGIKGSYDIRLEPVIDKTEPYVTVHYPQDDSANPKVRYVDVILEDLSEDCYMQDSGRTLFKAGEPITKRITENGLYTYRFYDAAGNTNSVSVKVTCIDAEAPIVLLNDLPEKDYFTNGDVTFRATLNEAGTITVNGVTQTVAAPIDTDGDGVFSEDECHWVTFTVTENGGYRITAEDSVGLITETYLSVSCIDRTAPTLLFNPTTLTFVEGSDRSAVEAALLGGITVRDGRSAADKITVTYAAFDDSVLQTVGIHPILITAKDEAGNSTTGTRYLRIYSAKEPEILVNGVKTYRGEIAIVRGTDINISIDKLSEFAGEPYTVYIRGGVWREGQMKTRSEKLTSLSYTAEKGLYYTLYIVTQSHNTYLTSFYVQ